MGYNNNGWSQASECLDRFPMERIVSSRDDRGLGPYDVVRSDWLALDALVEMIEALAHWEVGTPDPMYDRLGFGDQPDLISEDRRCNVSAAYALHI